MSLEYRVKELEKILENTIIPDPPSNSFEERIKKLEEWQTKHNEQSVEKEIKTESEITKTANYAGGLYAALEERIEKLEHKFENEINSTHYHETRLKKLEYFKERIDRDLGTEYGEHWVKGGISIAKLANDVNKLEEWKDIHKESSIQGSLNTADELDEFRNRIK